MGDEDSPRPCSVLTITFSPTRAAKAPGELEFEGSLAISAPPDDPFKSVEK
ncbi:hypothetical protein FRUB_02372 [Fimbriiglobus ruber]|uniref:Uncharacterized protein n=1 Tax=Fimbriiglobus ruber TaxID=1908690 RepID=A0A225DSJ6_9BACT|nr:hypothetical protein FRUB_02372 [Fimbriiglobus ruber]